MIKLILFLVLLLSFQIVSAQELSDAELEAIVGKSIEDSEKTGQLNPDGCEDEDKIKAQTKPKKKHSSRSKKPKPKSP